MVYVYNPVNLGAKCVNKPFHEKTQILHEDCIIAILDGTKWEYNTQAFTMGSNQGFLTTMLMHYTKVRSPVPLSS